MKNRILLFSSAFLMCTCLAWYASAQDESDALRFSNTSTLGTARSMGFGGALGSIGGDFSSLSVNPAGIGVYRASEFAFTPSIKLSRSESTYSGTGARAEKLITSDNNTRFTINNFSAVFTNAATGRRYKRSKWKAVSFGIGFNRIADFNSNHRYSGYNDSSSVSEIFLIDALNGANINDVTTLAGLGYESFLLNEDNQGFYTAPQYRSGLNQSRKVEQRGGMTDVNFSFGGNYEEKLFLGATVAIPSIRYNRDITFTEDDASGDPNNNFASLDYRESLQTRGTGINLKLGFIYSFNKYFRAGAAFHTPTYFGMNDEQTISINSNTENLRASQGYTGQLSSAQSTSTYQYSMVTPWKGVISAAGIIGKNGFITVDYEYVDYGSARINFDNADSRYQDQVNSGIKSMYKGASNIRVGGEAKFDMLMLRLGFGYFGNPYQDASQGSETMRYSAGVGFRFDNVFLDLGFAHTATESKEQPYTLNYSDPAIGNVWVPTADIKNSFNTVALTVGFKFK